MVVMSYDEAYPESWAPAEEPVTVTEPEPAPWVPVWPWQVPGYIAGRVADGVEAVATEAGRTARYVATEAGSTVRTVAPPVVGELGEFQDEGVGLTERMLTAIAGLSVGVPVAAVLSVGAVALVDQLALRGAGRKALVRALVL